MKPFDELQKYYNDHELAARLHKERGGKIIGYLSTNTPEELLYAAGFLPVRVVGSADEEVTFGDMYIENVCSVSIRSIVDLLAKGRYEYLDGLFMTHDTDSHVRMYYNLKAFPGLWSKPIFWLDVPHGKGRGQFNYLVTLLERMRASLEETYDVRITDEALFKAIRVYNENRALLRKVDNLRKIDPPHLTGKEVLQIIGAGFWMPKEQHNELLKKLLDEINGKRAVRKGLRVFLGGSAQDNLEVIDLIEVAGSIVVGDDLSTGARYFASDVKEATYFTPIESLACYLLNEPRPLGEPRDGFVNYFEKELLLSHAEGVIFYILQYEDDYGWQYPDLKDRAERLGVTHLLLEQQEYRVVAPERLRTRIEAFFEAIGQKKG